ncbi:MAG: hypothetical protein HC828_16875 [Blastochloris sp.]|nr:hypothetical protein [Blastochloris sp.]
MVDQGSEFNPDDTMVLAPNLTFGQHSEPLAWREGTANWTFVEGTDDERVLFRLRDIDVERDTSNLVVIGSERLFDESLRPLAFVIPGEARASFGGPQAIGYMLFTDYLLPFQMLALLLLAAMVGAIVLTHRETVRDRREMGRRRVVSARWRM